jgi:hypothetical protein
MINNRDEGESKGAVKMYTIVTWRKMGEGNAF